MLSFLLGAVTGAVAATYWHPELNRMRTERMPELRNRLADNVEALERAIVEGIGTLSTRTRDLLRGQSGGGPRSDTAGTVHGR
jgi:hypothetical protein